MTSAKPEDENSLSEILDLYPRDKRSVVETLFRLGRQTGRLASTARDVSVFLGRALSNSSDHLRKMQETGAYLKELREIAGLTLQELDEALDVEDQTLLTPVENGTATLSFELILRMAALLARHDPVPFVMRFVRTYNPEAWQILEDWGADRIPVHLERERQFINIYRGHDTARDLSEEGFQRILAFTRTAFEMALHFTDENTPTEVDEEQAQDD